jgi:hypothetical protein
LIANQLKLWIKIESSIKKYRRRIFFSKLQNGGLNGDGAFNHCFFLLVLTQPFFNRIQHINQFWTSCNKHFGTSLGQKENYSKWSKYSRWRFYGFPSDRLSFIFSQFSNL